MAGGFSVRGDLNPEIGEISLNLDLNSKTGEESPDRGSHAGEPTPADPPPSLILEPVTASAGPGGAGTRLR